MGRIINHKFSDKEDLYIKENYLLIPRKKIADHLNRGYELVKIRMKELGLVVPPEKIKLFKGTHKGVAEQKPKPEKKLKAKKFAASNRRGKPAKEPEPKFNNKAVDYSKMEMYRVDARTWKYRPKKTA